MFKKRCMNCQYCFALRFCNRFNRQLTELEFESENDCSEFLLWFGAIF